MSLGSIPSNLRLGVANVNAPKLTANGPNDWATQILGIPSGALSYQGCISKGRVFSTAFPSGISADWGTCNLGSADEIAMTNVIREASGHDSVFSWRNLTNQQVGGVAPNAGCWLYDYNGSSGSHTATRLNQLYYVTNEPETYALFCNTLDACSCPATIRKAVQSSPGDPNLLNVNFDQSLSSLFTDINFPFWEVNGLYRRVRARALAKVFKYVKKTVEDLGRGHIVLLPSVTGLGGPYWNDFFDALKFVTGVTRIAGSYIGALHIHSYSPVPQVPGQPLLPLENAAFIAARIRIGVNWYVNTYGADRNFNILLSEFGPLWSAKYGVFWGDEGHTWYRDVRPKIMSGFWDNYRDGLSWWSSLLCWLTREAPRQCNLQGWDIGLASNWTPTNTVFSSIHSPDEPPFVVVNNTVAFARPPGDPISAPIPPPLTVQSLARNQWFFHADAWATYYKPSPLGLESPNLVTYQIGSNPVYQTSFTSFFNDLDTSPTSGQAPMWTSAIPNDNRSYRRAPMGACYSVWAHPKVGGGPNSGNLASGWVDSQQTGLVGQSQVTLPGGYCTVYVPVIKGAGATGVLLSVQFTDGTFVYNAGGMSLDDIENYQSILITDQGQTVSVESYPAMIYPFVCYSAGAKTLMIRVNRALGTGPVKVGYPVVLKGACSWFITQ